MLDFYGLFLDSVTDQLPQLMRLLGDKWPEVRERLIILEPMTLSESQIVERIVEAISYGPAALLVEKLKREATEKASQAKPAMPSKRKRRGRPEESLARTASDSSRTNAAKLLIEQVRIAVQPAPAPFPAEIEGRDITELRETRQITVTGHTLGGEALSYFDPGQTYRLRFGVKAPTTDNLAQGDTTVNDIPSGGLKTHWVVTSRNVEFVRILGTCDVQKFTETWLAKFDLLIPETGSSKTEEIAFVGSAGIGIVLVTLYTVAESGEKEIYRDLTVRLAGIPKVTADETSKAALHTNLRTSHEWTTPPVHIQVSIKNGLAEVTTKRYRLEVYEFVEPFVATDILLAGAIVNVRKSLDRLREIHASYFEDLDHNKIAARLSQGSWKPYDWEVLLKDTLHSSTFDAVQQTTEWRDLASDGYTLFDRCFPENTLLRALIKKLPPGSRIDFHWSAQSGPGFVSHVPWALMHLASVDPMGDKLAAPENFLGLRFRIAARSWPVKNGSVVLGSPNIAHSLNLLYWGRKPGDDVGVEAEWQALEFGGSKQATLLPNIAAPDLKRQIIQAMDSPAPSPVAVIYFYCHCSVGDGADPCLRFGSTSKREDTLGRNDLSKRSIPDGPLIFANACTTAQADPHMTSDLEQAFFDRGVRAFIGTESKVPIKLASKFAWLYFQFFYRHVDCEPMTAGEALAQSRLFLWTQFRNVGGLFYSISNQYDLYLASSEEVLSLR